MDDLVSSFLAQFNICPDVATTRSAAKRANLKNVNCFTCICCHRSFDTHRLIVKHIKSVHKADKEAIKKQYYEDKATLEQNPESPAALRNFNLSALQLAFLIKFKIVK